MACKPEHVVDLGPGAIVSAVIHPADQGDTKTIATTLDDTQARLCAIKGKEDTPDIVKPFDLAADKGYHSREVLRDLPDCCRSRISEPKHAGQLRWHGDVEARKAVVRRYMGIVPGCNPAKARRFYAHGARNWSAALPFTLTGAVCGAAFCAEPRI